MLATITGFFKSKYLIRMNLFIHTKEYRDRFPKVGRKIRDWPRYRRDEPGDDTTDLIMSQAALVSMCDDQLGRILDVFDAENLWKDTALIVTTDHGFMLGEQWLVGKESDAVLL